MTTSTPTSITQVLAKQLECTGFGVLIWTPESGASGHAYDTYAYTVGLSVRAGHPELVVVGLAPEVAAPFLHALGARVMAGARFTDAIWDNQTTPDSTLAFCPITTPPFDVLALDPAQPRPEWLQVLYTDREGRYPWQRRAGDPWRSAHARTLPSLGKH